MSEVTPIGLPVLGRQIHADPYLIPLDEIDVADRVRVASYFVKGFQEMRVRVHPW